jgi:rhodanese-related sulfurtransferase
VILCSIHRTWPGAALAPIRDLKEAGNVPTEIGREEVQQLVAGGAQLVEVLPKEEFDEHHLPGAIHIPLRTIDPGVRVSLASRRPVVVYCWDSA